MVQRENQECLLLEGGLPRFLLLAWVKVSRCKFILSLSLLCLREWLIKLFILGSGHDFTHLGDVVLQQRVRDLQSADEHECRCIFIVVENFGKLALEVADVGFEIVTMPHFDGEEVVIVLLGLPV